MTEKNTRAPNRWVADKLGMTISGASRIRSGARMPSREAMILIEEHFGFKGGDQLDAMNKGEYHVVLEEYITETHKKENQE